MADILVIHPQDSHAVVVESLRKLNRHAIADALSEALAHQRRAEALPSWRWLATRLATARYRRAMTRLRVSLDYAKSIADAEVPAMHVPLPGRNFEMVVANL